jgi:hypothetical protein
MQGRGFTQSVMTHRFLFIEVGLRGCPITAAVPLTPCPSMACDELSRVGEVWVGVKVSQLNQSVVFLPSFGPLQSQTVS